MNWIHIMDPILFGLCPICWFFIVLTVVLIIVWFNLKPKKHEGVKEETI